MRLTEAADRVAAQRDVADMEAGGGGGDDTSWILDGLRRWQHQQQQQERQEHREDHPEFATRRRHLRVLRVINWLTERCVLEFGRINHSADDISDLS